VSKFLLVLIFIIPILTAVAFSFHDALRVILFVEAMPPLERSLVESKSQESLKETRQKIQSYFLENDLYLPFEDIFSIYDESMKIEYGVHIQKACGQGKLFVWVPLKIKLPLFGEKVVEWCWKPRILQ
jgi:hypothetical protein